MRYLISIAFSLLLVFARVQAQETERPAEVLSAYYGLDDALPRVVNRICRRGAGLDGMPVIFSHHIDANTLEPEDFAVITASGEVNTPRCVTLGPAADVGELRTALLIGQFGNAETDAPQTVEIVEDILSGSGDPGSVAIPEGITPVNFIGLTIQVTPLEAGPFLVSGENVPEADWVLDVRGQQGQGSGCPSEGTLQIVRAKWSGGVAKPDGSEVNDLEREQYQVTIMQEDETEILVTPFALGDLDDGDNNHLLCLDTVGTPTLIHFSAGYLVDPNRDTLNPDTSIPVVDMLFMNE